MIPVLLVLFLALCMQGRGIRREREGDGTVVGFWNVYAQGAHYRAIIDEQRRVMESSGLLDRIHTMYYVTMGEEGAQLRLSGPKLRHLRDYGWNGSEVDTLHEVASYCKGNPASTVLYFHNKGSLNFNVMNTNFRRALDCFILNPQCLDALQSGYDTCGWRLSPLPHMHYSGNYWWATCRHINKLISPTIHRYNQTFLSATARLYPRSPRTTELPSPRNPFPDQPYLGLGRYFAETWVTSLPLFAPSDCMNATVNNRYMWGKFPLPWRMVNKRCPNFKEDFMISTRQYDTSQAKEAPSAAAAGTDALAGSLSSPRQYLNYGLPCALAGFIAQPKVVHRRFPLLSSANCTAELRERSQLWYGQPPKLHIEWLKLYDNL